MDAVIFDMDGVIVDSERYWQPLEEELFAETVGPGVVTPTEVTGMNIRDEYDYLEEEYGTSLSKDEFIGQYDATASQVYESDVDLMPEFERVLATVRDREVRLALASSSPIAWIRMVLDRFDLHEWFEEVVSGDELDARSKPEPDIYLHTASLLGVDPEQCVAVEDSAHGARAAKAAGMYCIGFRTDLNQNQDLSAADIVVENPSELRDVLLEAM